MESVLDIIYANVIEGQRAAVEQEVRRALEARLAPEVILNQGLIAAMAEVGSRFEQGDFFVPEMLIAARAMQAGLAILKPYLVDEGVKSVGRVVIGTVKGDLHDIGKNLVAMMLQGAGYEIIDLGTDVSPEKFVNAVEQHTPDILAMSALLTTTMVSMKSTLDALDVAGVRDRVKVMVGGAPLTESFARQVGADGFAKDASQAVNLANSLIASL